MVSRPALVPVSTAAAEAAAVGATEQAEPLDLDALLDRITQLKAAQKAIESELTPLLDQLHAAFDGGELDPSFSHNDFSFCWSPGRLSYAYPEPLRQQEQSLKQAQKSAVESGTATIQHGNPFWTIKAPRAV
ncbi:MULTISPECIES: hypothetical protein [unclassified Synechococcus]|uniref:hypothetical protein n=1 Tax=unclassified Synechococcus TaxID=2626047 RepID=UPI0020CFB58C|nr:MULTISPECIES: hypothetical protein [unclassified Synechococcus]